jgi:hypothetical protein
MGDREIMDSGEIRSGVVVKRRGLIFLGATGLYATGFTKEALDHIIQADR